MKRLWQTPATALAGLFLTCMSAVPETYTISARPGGVNYVEGQAFLNGQPLSEKGLKLTFLNSNDILSTGIGKAEVLLTPGIFLRIGDNSAVRMIVPHLTTTQVEVTSGEAFLEVAGLSKDNNIQILSHRASITILKNGLYRFNADDVATAATINGKAQVDFEEKKITLGKGRETVLNENLKAQKLDKKKEDELYAWSNVRSEYTAAASYQSARAISVANDRVGYGPGWLWNSAYDTWAWLPGAGAFYSPFGWGFYSPGTVADAPVITGPVFRSGHWVHRDEDHNANNPGKPERGHRDWQHHQWIGTYTNASVPVNVNRPPGVGSFAGSPWADQAARVAAAQSFIDPGVHTASGQPAATFWTQHIENLPSGNTPNRGWDRRGPAGSNGTQTGGAGADAPTAHGSGRWSGDGECGAWPGGHAGGNWSAAHGGGEGHPTGNRSGDTAAHHEHSGR